MIKIEKVLISEAKRFFEEAKYAASGGDENNSTIELANSMGLSLESFWREEWAGSFQKCNAICDLTMLDSGLSNEAIIALSDISSNANKLIVK